MYTFLYVDTKTWGSYYKETYTTFSKEWISFLNARQGNISNFYNYGRPALINFYGDLKVAAAEKWNNLADYFLNFFQKSNAKPLKNFSENDWGRLANIFKECLNGEIDVLECLTNSRETNPKISEGISVLETALKSVREGLKTENLVQYVKNNIDILSKTNSTNE